MKNTKNELIKNIQVEPCTSNRTGEAVKNQYIISFPGGWAFQSYNSLIATYIDDVLTLGCDFDYSVTTIKYLHQFLEYYCYSIYRELPTGRSVKDILYKAIKSGLIKYDENMR